MMKKMVTLAMVLMVGTALFAGCKKKVDAPVAAPTAVEAPAPTAAAPVQDQLSSSQKPATPADKK